MMPAQPPLPTAWYLPFHAVLPDAPSAPGEGSHTSILMSESDECVSVAATRQYAGSCSGGAAQAGAASSRADSAHRIRVVMNISRMRWILSSIEGPGFDPQGQGLEWVRC